MALPDTSEGPDKSAQNSYFSNILNRHSRILSDTEKTECSSFPYTQPVQSLNQTHSDNGSTAVTLSHTEAPNKFNLLATDFFFQILAHPVFKM